MPSLSSTCTTGARQLVVQEAFETMWCLAGSYSPSLTPIEQRLHVALAGRRDDHLLGAGREVALGLLRVGEEAGRLDHVVGPQLLPRQLARVLGGHHALDLVAAHHQHVVVLLLRVALLRGHGVLEAAVHRVVLHLVGEVVGVGRDVDDTHDVDLLAQQALVAQRLEDQATNPSKAVDPYADCHEIPPFISSAALPPLASLSGSPPDPRDSGGERGGDRHRARKAAECPWEC